MLEEDHATGKRFFKFNRGPIFAQVVLADEINRTPPKTQAALLEAMQEGAVTYGGTTYPLQRPFFVLATQNPIEQTGTYPLPEAQLDRFLLYIRVDYPVGRGGARRPGPDHGGGGATPAAAASAQDILAAQQLVREIPVSDPLLDYAARLVRSSRPASSDLS